MDFPEWLVRPHRCVTMPDWNNNLGIIAGHHNMTFKQVQVLRDTKPALFAFLVVDYWHDKVAEHGALTIDTPDMFVRLTPVVVRFKRRK